VESTSISDRRSRWTSRSRPSFGFHTRPHAEISTRLPEEFQARSDLGIIASVASRVLARATRQATGLEATDPLDRCDRGRVTIKGYHCSIEITIGESSFRSTINFCSSRGSRLTNVISAPLVFHDNPNANEIVVDARSLARSRASFFTVVHLSSFLMILEQITSELCIFLIRFPIIRLRGGGERRDKEQLIPPKGERETEKCDRDSTYESMDKAPPNDTYSGGHLDCVNTSSFVCADTTHASRVAKLVKQPRIPEQITCIVEPVPLSHALCRSLSSWRW